MGLGLALSSLALICLLSGAAGLIFETVWFHRAGLVFGSTVWSTTLVLSSFMGGLTIGAGLVARFGTRVRRFLVAYAAAELTVAAAGIAITIALPTLTNATANVVYSEGHVWQTNIARFVAGFLVLLIPATAMGATLPLLAAAVASSGRGFGAALGWAYGWNTFGAVAGALGAELLLVPTVGVGGSAFVAAALCLAAAILGARGSGLEARKHVASADLEAPVAPSDAHWRRSTTVLLVSSFLSGATLLGLEVVWFRFLTMFVLSTTLAATTMLAVVLASIGLGGLIASAWLTRSPGAWRHLPALAFAAGAGVVSSYAGFQLLTSGTQIAEWYRTVWLACALTAPASILSGTLFTFTGAALDRVLRAGPRTAGWVTLSNTAGSMCGPLVATFVLLPRAGVERSFLAAAVAYAAVGLVVAVGMGAPGVRLRSPGLVGAAAALAVSIAFFPHDLMGRSYFPRISAPYATDGSAIVATREGPSETILLMQRKWLGEPVYTRLVTNGFSMSGTNVSALRYMRYFVYWPLAVHRGPLRNVLVICYGVGVTAGAARDIPDVETIDVVDISREVVAMSDVLYAPDAHPLHDQRVRVHVEDGRQFLQATPRRFDLITGEPPPPRTPGAVNIYTREYFQLVFDRLADNGIATYWLPVGRPDPGTNVDAIVAAFCDVFADCSLWNATPYDLMLAGTRGTPASIPEDDFVRPWTVPALRTRLAEIGLELPQQVGATFLGDAAYLRELTADVQPLVDDYPHRLLPNPRRPSLSDPGYGKDPAVTAHYQAVLDPARAKRAFESSSFIRRAWPERVLAATLPYFEHQPTINAVFLEGGRPLREIDTLHRLLTDTPLRTLPLWLMSGDATTEAIARRHDDGSGGVWYVRGLTALANRDYPGAAAAFGEAEQRGLGEATLRPLRAYALALSRRTGEASRLVPAQPGDDDQRRFWLWLRHTFGVGS
jgi:spermidine synthase